LKLPFRKIRQASQLHNDAALDVEFHGLGTAERNVGLGGRRISVERTVDTVQRQPVEAIAAVVLTQTTTKIGFK
jgi:hypothetical protein